MVKKVTPSKFKPFQLVTTDKGKVIIVAGNTQCSPIEFDTEEDAEIYLHEQPYEMFTNLYSIFKYYETEEANSKRKKSTDKNAAKH